MKIEKAIEILTKAIDYNADGSCKKDSWILSTEGIEAIKTVINEVCNIHNKR